MTLDATWAGPSAESYLTLEAADAWIRRNNVFFDEWILAKEPQQIAALLEATRNIDAINWHGARYNYQQALAFPRVPPGGEYPIGALGSSVSAFESLMERDEYFKRQVERVQRAACQQTLYILRKEGKDTDREEQFQGVTSLSRGGRGVMDTRNYGALHMILCPQASDQLRYYRATGPRITRGDTVSAQW